MLFLPGPQFVLPFSYISAPKPLPVAFLPLNRSMWKSWVFADPTPMLNRSHDYAVTGVVLRLLQLLHQHHENNTLRWNARHRVAVQSRMTPTIIKLRTPAVRDHEIISVHIIRLHQRTIQSLKCVDSVFQSPLDNAVKLSDPEAQISVDNLLKTRLIHPQLDDVEGVLRGASLDNVYIWPNPLYILHAHHYILWLALQTPQFIINCKSFLWNSTDLIIRCRAFVPLSVQKSLDCQ